MFTNILFLILALLLINTIPEKVNPWIESDIQAFGLSIFIYTVFCGFIFIQYFVLKKLLKNRHNLILAIVCTQLLVYLMIYQYILDAGRIFQRIPHMENMQFLNSTWELILYLGGLATFYSATFVRYSPFDKSENRFNFALRKLLFIIPFTFPFIFISFIIDLLNMGVNSKFISQQSFEWLSIILTLVLIVLILIFLPYFIQKAWQCKALPDSLLRDRLEDLCRRANFRHAGMKTWTIMHDHLTAGIVGVVPTLRYVMFTDRLLRELSASNVEAILAHEIGHNTHRHLLIYPFILAGMVVCAGLFFQYFSEPIMNFLEMQNAMHPSVFWDFFNPVFIFLLYAIIVVVYFRFVFGFFSRLFERQADLHIYEVGIDPHAMIDALLSVAPSSGGYATPNWHHYSIKERVEFLKATISNPTLIEQHHRKVKIILGLYFIIFCLSLVLLIGNT